MLPCVLEHEIEHVSAAQKLVVAARAVRLPKRAYDAGARLLEVRLHVRAAWQHVGLLARRLDRIEQHVISRGDGGLRECAVKHPVAFEGADMSEMPQHRTKSRQRSFVKHIL